MLESHRLIVERITQRYRSDPDVLALIVIGSVARGEAHERSDVDVLVILTDEAYARYQASDVPPLSAEELAGKHHDARPGVRDKAYLRAAAERGPEPTRFAFVQAMVPFSRDPEIEPLLAAIPTYPEHEREGKLASFASQLPVHLSYLYLGDYSENPYILADSAHELALFGGRLILAHNRFLFPGRKHFLSQLERAPQKPDRFLWLMRRLLRQPCIPTAEAFCEAVMSFQPWPHPAEGHGARYVQDRDLAWLHQPPALGES
ncbi:MAG: nucleotidyltransferase domain-containing protein [Chloroflexota bacterium]|nr:nucleotidyltransferase domain-containing protein [Chloroflexota bacterium]